MVATRNTDRGARAGSLLDGLRLPKSALLLGLALAVAVPGHTTTSPACQVRSAIVVDAGRVDASCLINEKNCPGLREQLEKIPLGIIPEPLGALTLPREQIEKLLGPLASQLVLPRRVQVRRRGDILAGKEVADRIASFCQESAGLADPDNLSLDLTRIPGSIVLPGPLQSYDVRPISGNRFGLRLFSLEVACQGGQVRQIIQVEVARKVRAARLKRLVKPGEMLTEGDLSEEILIQRNDQAQPLLKLEEAQGKRVATYKSAGTYLRVGDVHDSEVNDPNVNHPNANALDVSGSRSGRHGMAAVSGRSTARAERASWIVKPGEKVEFFVKSGGLSLKVPAKALEGGGVGESIKLINLQNNRQITGIVTAAGKVEYGFN